MVPSADEIGVQLHSSDNVAAVSRDLDEGTIAGGLTVRTAVPRSQVDELVADLLADRSPGQQVLCSVDLRRLTEDGGPSVTHQQVDGGAQGGLRGHAGVRVRAGSSAR